MTLIELHVPDFEKVKRFYMQLGFKVVWERKPEKSKGYLVMKLEDNIICFWAGNEEVFNHSYFKQYPKTTKKGYAVEIIFMVSDIENYYKKVKSICKVVEEFKQQPWGLWDFRIEDPFGFYIRFTEPHNTLDSKYAIA